MTDLADLLYHEKQVSQLCGLHALNTLLQGPYFTEVDCAQIALELDRLEKELMAAGGLDSREFLEFMAQKSNNVDDGGFFSIQVLQRALEALGLEASQAPAQQPEREHAFICNLEEHWFTILRKRSGEWWDLNSLLPAPRPLSALHLEAYLSQLRAEGYSIFVIRGALPLRYPDATAAQEHRGPGRWLTPEEAREMGKQAGEARERGYARAAAAQLRDRATKAGTLVTLQSSRGPGPATRSSGTAQGLPNPSTGASPYEDEDLQRALQASLAHQGAGAARGAGQAGSQSRRERADPDANDASLARALAESLEAVGAAPGGKGPAPGGEAPVGSKRGREGAEAEGEAEASEAAALEPEPEEGPGVVELAVRLSSGERPRRRFRRQQPLGDVLAWLRSVPGGPRGGPEPQLGRQYPRTVLKPEQTIAKAGLHNKEVLLVLG